MSANKDFSITRGVTFNPYLIYKSNGSPVNITGYTATMALKKEYSRTASATYTTQNSKLVITGASGRIDIEVSDTDTAALTAGRYFYNLTIDSGTETIGLLHGVITVNESTNV